MDNFNMWMSFFTSPALIAIILLIILYTKKPNTSENEN